jgi:hypothetical protein
MITLVRCRKNSPMNVLAIAWGICYSWSAPTIFAAGAELDAKGVAGNEHHGHGRYGTLGYGGYGLYPGYQGFGLKYHPGYGYGGCALGVGAFGGYPFYGGPGYPHDAPGLKPFCGIAPFPYFGGPGYSSYGHPNFFDEPGQLVVNEPVAQENADLGDSDARGKRVDYPDTGGYGIFTGMIPYPESLFAPYTAAAATGSSSTGEVAFNRAANAQFIATARDFGIDEESIVDTDGVRAIRISNVYPGTAPARARLQIGDVIRSVNGFRTEQQGNLAWIIANATPRTELKINVRKLSDGKVRSVTMQFP